MASSGEPFIPNRVLSASEIMRIGVALHVYGEHLTESSYVVMEKAKPHEVIGVVATKSEAEAVRRGRGAGAATKFDIYGPFSPPDYPYDDRFEPVEHDPGTESTLCGIIEKKGKKDLPKPGDVVKVTLRVDWKPGGRRDANDQGAPNSITYEIRHNADSIFLTRHAREGFMYPRYHVFFGADYVTMLRGRLRDPA